MTSTLPIAVLLSGSGRTLENFLEKIDHAKLPVSVVAVASDREGVRGIEVARDAGLPVRVFARRAYTDRTQRDLAMLTWLREHGPKLLCLAGYLALLDVQGAEGLPILNIHPALLPAYGGKGYYGDRVHAAVLAEAEAESGATVHLVNERFDEGAIIARAVVPVLQEDDVSSLAHRVFDMERELYPAVLRWLAKGELKIEGGLPRGSDGPWEVRTLHSPG